MCGVTAIVDCAGQNVAARLASATAQLRHRGPDGTDSWVQKKGLAGLGHTRLSVMDPAGGRQPLSNEDGTVQVTINGEFYGYEDLRRQLERKGHCFRTRSDSEVLPHLYEESGVDCLRYLRGEFAFVLWDDRRSRLWAARDRFGIKPLFYCLSEDGIMLASEAKSLFAAGVPPAWDSESVLEQTLFFVRQDRCLFRNVRQLPAGHYLIYENGRLQVTQYWDLDYPESRQATALGKDHCEEMQRALQDAVRVRLQSDAPVTVFLSGGLDSSCVLAFAAEAGMRSPSAIHVSFPGTDYDERAMASRAALQAGARLEVLELGEQCLVNNIGEAVWHGEMLAFNSHGVARYLQSQLAQAAGYKVALTGEGADETLAGYPGFRDDATTADPRHPRRGVRVLQQRLGFSPAWIDRIHRERSVFYALLSPPYRDAVTFDGICEAFIDQFDVSGQLQGRHPLQQSMYLWMKSVLPNYTLCADRLDMANGIETRPPFLDHLLWEFTRKLPADLLIRGREEKWILRAMSAGKIPEEIRGRTKHSFTAPVFGRSGPLHDLLQDELRSTGFRSVPFFDHDAVVSLLDMIEIDPMPGVASVLMLMLCSHLLNKSYHLS
jgi:asparagine synthase (glutamine-hydrolysing)